MLNIIYFNLKLCLRIITLLIIYVINPVKLNTFRNILDKGVIKMISVNMFIEILEEIIRQENGAYITTKSKLGQFFIMGKISIIRDLINTLNLIYKKGDFI